MFSKKIFLTSFFDNFVLGLRIVGKATADIYNFTVVFNCPRQKLMGNCVGFTSTNLSIQKVRGSAIKRMEALTKLMGHRTPTFDDVGGDGISTLNSDG